LTSIVRLGIFPQVLKKGVRYVHTTSS